MQLHAEPPVFDPRHGQHLSDHLLEPMTVRCHLTKQVGTFLVGEVGVLIQELGASDHGRQRSPELMVDMRTNSARMRFFSSARARARSASACAAANCRLCCSSSVDC